MSRLTGSEAKSLMEAYQAVYAPQEITEEQIWEEVETWVNSLLEEGYDLSEYTWEEMYEAYLSEDIKSFADKGGLVGAASRAYSRSGTEQGKAQNRAAVGKFFGGINQGATKLMQTGGVFGRGGVVDRMVGKPAAPAPTKPPATPPTKPAASQYNAKNLGAAQYAAFKSGGGDAAIRQGYSAGEVVARGRAATNRADGGPRPAAPAPSKPTPAPSKPTPAPAGQGPKVTPTKPAGSAMDQWAKANPKLAAAAAEKARIRGTQQTDNPLMKDMKSRLPMNSPSVQSPDVAKLGAGNQSLVNNPNAFKAAPEVKKTAAIAATPKPLPVAPSQNLKQSYEYDAFDLVLEYLIDNGHVETVDEALYVMMEMDAEVIRGIVEEVINEDSATLSAAARRRAQEMGAKRRRTPAYKAGGNRGTGRNERAAYNLSNIQRTGAANPDTQRTRSRRPSTEDTGMHQGDYERYNRKDPKKNPKHDENK